MSKLRIKYKKEKRENKRLKDANSPMIYNPIFQIEGRTVTRLNASAEVFMDGLMHGTLPKEKYIYFAKCEAIRGIFEQMKYFVDYHVVEEYPQQLSVKAELRVVNDIPYSKESEEERYLRKLYGISYIPGIKE